MVEMTLLTALALLRRPGYSFLPPKRPAVVLLTACMEANHTTAIVLSVTFLPLSLSLSPSISDSLSVCVCVSLSLSFSPPEVCMHEHITLKA